MECVFGVGFFDFFGSVCGAFERMAGKSSHCRVCGLYFTPSTNRNWTLVQ
jgi:hypothetical protein